MMIPLKTIDNCRAIAIAGLIALAMFLAGPVLAANYDGKVRFGFTCRSDEGEWMRFNQVADVRDGKFKVKKDVPRDEGSGCKINGCWHRWEGQLDENGRYRITYQMNSWDRKAKVIDTFTLVGQFTSSTSAPGVVTEYPGSWILQCKDETVSLIDPAPESLAGREGIARSAAVKANAADQSKAADLISAKSEALSVMMEANLLLPELGSGSNRTLLEAAIHGTAGSLKTETAEQIRAQSKLLSQIIQSAREANRTVAATGAPSVAQVAPQQALSQAASQKRVALVIGNSAYRNAVELPNPRNDARAISTILRGLKFEVIEGADLAKADMDEKIRLFAEAVKPADLALFFYAGHGMQVAGKNYLIPVDAKLESASSIDFETTDAEQVLNYMADGNRIAIALLDACRDNPLARQFARSLGVTRSGSVTRGLAPASVESGGLLIGFATAPGDVALDGTGSNSPFTTALVSHLADKGLEFEQVLKRVKADVIKATDNKQRPWMNSDIASDVYLNP